MNIPLSKTFNYWTNTIWAPLSLLALAVAVNCLLNENKPGFGVGWILFAGIFGFLSYRSIQDQAAWDEDAEGDLDD